MIISKRKMTETALGLVKDGDRYDEQEIAQAVASLIADNLYIEFGGTKGMSLRTRDELKEAFHQIAIENIDWTALNRKTDPDGEYADYAWRSCDPEERL